MRPPNRGERERLNIMLSERADDLREGEIDFLHGLVLRREWTVRQRAWFSDIWREVMNGPRKEEI